MLKQDLAGWFTGEFDCMGERFSYRAEGYGKPIVLTGSLSSGASPYAWRFIFECLAGSYFVYELDLGGILGQKVHGHIYCSKVLQYFLKEIVGTETTIVSGQTEAYSVIQGMRSTPRFASRAIILCPEGVRVVRARRSTVVTQGLSLRKASPMLIPGAVRRISKLQEMAFDGQPKRGICRESRAGPAALPGGKSPVRICEDIGRFLG